MTSDVSSILDQYASPAGRSLYRYMMGGDSDHTHYGIYELDADSMHEASIRSCRRLLDGAMTDSGDPQTILDLGAGSGGPAQCLLGWTQARVIAVDVGEEPLNTLQAWSHANGMSDRLDIHPGNFEKLPSDWTERFDLVWSQEAICHAQDRLAVFREARRVLKPGGVFAFTDILLADSAPLDEARVFTSVNSGPRMQSPSVYLGALMSAGFRSIHREDWSAYLPKNFQAMREALASHRELLLELGVTRETIEQFSASLDRRLRWSTGSVLQWWAHWCRAEIDQHS